MLNKPDLVLIDGTAYLFRAYHALPPLSNSKGEPTGAVVGVINMLRKLIQEIAPPHLAVVFDAKGPTFRDQLAADYKAQRAPAPEDLIAQIEPLYAIVRALGLPLLSVSGVEADDVIGTLAVQAERAGMSVLIITGDKDFAQLVTERITLLDTMTEHHLDVPGVYAKFGVHPQQIIDFLTLTGDKIDNVPGIPGCGPKTAQKWLAQYGDLNTLLAHVEDIKSKVGAALRANLTQLALSKTLVTIKCDVQLTQTPQDLRPTSPDIATLRSWYQRLEATRLLAALPADVPVVAFNPGGGEDLFLDLFPTKSIDSSPNQQLILDWPMLQIWLTKLAAAPFFAINVTTTDSTNPITAKLVGIAFAIEPNQTAYLPLAHSVLGTPQQLKTTAVLAAFKPLLEDHNCLKIGHNLKFSMNVLANYGINLRGLAFDTMLESYILNSQANRHDLNTLTTKHLNYTASKLADLVGTGTKQLMFDQVALESAGHYAAETTDVTLQLHNTLWPRLKEQPQLATLLQDLEMPLIPVLSRIERAGVRLNTAQLKVQSKDLAQRITVLENQVQTLVGHAFNLNSPKQISTVLYQELKLPVLEKTPNGVASTAESALERLVEQGHELPRWLLEHRTLTKLKSTYLDPLPRLINPNTGRVHTCYNQAATATGRLSSVNPNLQNIPIRSEDGRRIRQAFIAAEGCSLLAADYSQIELRIMAHLSSDIGLLHAFATGQDVHRATAAEIFNVTPETVTTEQRRCAKIINFGLIYGMSAFGLAHQLTISNAEAQRYVDKYFQRYPGVNQFMERIRVQARHQGFVETLFGRRLYVPEINARNTQRRLAAERTAINAPLQGTAADIIKRAMLAVDNWLQMNAIPAKIIMQIHDELVLEVQNNYLESVLRQVTTLMENVTQLQVPLIVDSGCGANWDEAH